MGGATIGLMLPRKALELRLVAQALSDVINALPRIAYPERFGTLDDRSWRVLAANLRELRRRFAADPSSVPWMRVQPRSLPELVELAERPVRTGAHRLLASELARHFLDALGFDVLATVGG
jgi:hypothetical protein